MLFKIGGVPNVSEAVDVINLAFAFNFRLVRLYRIAAICTFAHLGLSSLGGVNLCEKIACLRLSLLSRVTYRRAGFLPINSGSL